MYPVSCEVARAQQWPVLPPFLRFRALQSPCGCRDRARHPPREPPPERRYNEAEKGEQDVTLTAESASVNWDTKKKIWMTSIKVGAEVIRRWSDKSMPQNAGDDLLRAWVVQTTKDEGYEMAPERVRIER